MAIISLEELPEDTKTSESKIIPIDQLPEDKSPAEKPSITSEATKVAGQAAVGVSQGLLDVGNKPFSELQGGEVGSKLDEGYLIGNKIRAASPSDIASTIKRFAMSGVSGIQDAMQVDTGDTLHTKYGFPVLPKPETGVGKALGIAANILAQGATLGSVEGKLAPSFNLKMPKVAEIDSGIRTIKNNVAVIKDTNAENLFRTQDGIDTNKISQNIKDSEALTRLDVQKTKLSDSIAQEIQGAPGSKGLALKASQELGRRFAEEYNKFAGEEVHVDDVTDGVAKVLQQYGVIDGAGERVPDTQLNPSQAKVLKFYEDLKSDKPGIIQMDSKKITLGELDKGLKSMFGKSKQYGSDEHILTDIRHAMTDYVVPLREIGVEFAPDFKLRNSVYDKFHVFDRMGFRRGSGEQSSGMGVLQNLAHEDPSAVLPQNQRMMEFLKEYGGNDPSEPVKSVGRQIVGIKQAAQTRNIGSQVLLQNLRRDIFNTNLKSEQSAAENISTLERLRISAEAKEVQAALNKKIAVAAGSFAAGMVAKDKVVSTVKKFIP